jgi:DnaJ-class molecular chaperone
MEFRDYYSTLGVPKTASEKEIKQAYRKLARKLHPDVNPGDKTSETKFKEINEAYEVLGDSDKRKKYDELGANWRNYEQAQQAYGGQRQPGAWTVNVGPDGQTFTVEDFEGVFGDSEGPFSDFFKTFFGGTAGGGGGARARSGRASNRRRPGHDVELDLPLTLEEAFHGTRKRVAVKDGGHARTVDVRIPAGVKDRARLRVQGEGEAGAGGAAAGDLFLRIHMQPHERFDRRGQDLHTKIRLPLLTAVLGGEAEVPTLSGKSLRLKIPEATQNGQVFRLRGHGMPTPQRPDEVGDLYVTMEAELPRTVTPAARRHFEALADLDKQDRQGT